MTFVHLNVHSHYSKGWGIGTIEELCRAAGDMGLKKLALTDTNSLYGLVFFVEAAGDMGVEPIVGSELSHNGNRAVLLVKNPRGYANLSRIISARHCHQDFDLIKTLREKGYGVTNVEAQGSDGNVHVIFMVIRRADFATITNLIKKFNPKAFYTLEDVKFVSEGIFPIKKAGIPKSLYFPPFKYWRKGK